MEITTCDSGSDSSNIPFIICFAISAGGNLVLVAIIILACLFMKQKKKILTIYRYENYNNNVKIVDETIIMC